MREGAEDLLASTLRYLQPRRGRLGQAAGDATAVRAMLNRSLGADSWLTAFPRVGEKNKPAGRTL